MDYLKQPEASGSCTPGGAAALAQIAKKQQDRRTAMSLPPVMYDRDNPFQRPLTGTLTSVYVWDRAGYPLHASNSKPTTPPGMVAKGFVDYLIQTFPRQFSAHIAHGDTENNTLIFGFGVDEVLRIAAFEIIRANLKLPVESRMDVPVRLWHNPLGVYDPFEIALSATHRKDINLDGLLKFVGSVHREADMINDAEVQALAAYDIVEACCMVPAQMSVVV